MKKVGDPKEKVAASESTICSKAYCTEPKNKAGR